MKFFYGLLFTVLCYWAPAQKYRLQAAYNYLYSPALDKAVQTYNFSRPFLSNPQPLLISGSSIETSILFAKDARIKHSINLQYTLFRSYAENNNLNNVLVLHWINAGYSIYFYPLQQHPQFYNELSIFLAPSGLFRKVNGKPFEINGSRAKSLGIAAGLKAQAGYIWMTGKQLNFSIFASINVMPYWYAPNNEAIINQTKGLVVKNTGTSAFGAQIGIAAYFPATGKFNR